MTFTDFQMSSSLPWIAIVINVAGSEDGSRNAPVLSRSPARPVVIKAVLPLLYEITNGSSRARYRRREIRNISAPRPTPSQLEAVSYTHLDVYKRQQ